jgi:hypothetical protein
MSGVFKILTPHPPHRPVSVYPRFWCEGRTDSLGGVEGWGSIFWKTPDTALYSTNVSTLWCVHLRNNSLSVPINGCRGCQLSSPGEEARGLVVDQSSLVRLSQSQIKVIYLT